MGNGSQKPIKQMFPCIKESYMNTNLSFASPPGFYLHKPNKRYKERNEKLEENVEPYLSFGRHKNST